MAPAGGDNQAGGHAELGVNLAEHFKAALRAPGRGSDDVIRIHNGGVDGGGGDLQPRGLRSPASCDQGDDQVAVIVEGEDVVGLNLQSGIVSLCLDLDGARQDAGDGDDGLHALHGVGSLHVFLLVLLGVEHVHENDRGHVHQLKAGIHGGAEGVEVVAVFVLFLAVTELADGLCPVVGNDRGVGHFVGVIRHVDGCGSEDHLQPRRPGDGGDDAGGSFLHPDAMLVRHN